MSRRIHYDFKTLLDSDESVFIINDRMYYCMTETEEEITIEEDGVTISVEPMWSRNVEGADIQLDLVAVREVASLETTEKKKKKKFGDLSDFSFPRSLFCVGQTSETDFDDEESKYIFPEKVPDNLQEAYSKIFPRDYRLQQFTHTARRHFQEYYRKLTLSGVLVDENGEEKSQQETD